MRPLRWKAAFQSGNPHQDRENKALTACLNSMLDASRQKEHCKDVEDVLAQMVQQAEGLLQGQADPEAIQSALRQTLLSSLPLPSHETESCDRCGFCDLAMNRVADHLQTTTQCMGMELKNRQMKG